MKSRKSIVKELHSARGRATTATKRIEKAGATKNLAYQALQRRGGIGSTVKGKSTQELRQELRSLNKFLKSQVATKAGLYQSQHRRPGKAQYKKASETRKANAIMKRFGVSKGTLEDYNQMYETSKAISDFPRGVDIDKLKRPELIAKLNEVIPLIQGQQKYLQMEFGETPATKGLSAAGGFPDDLSDLSYNELRKLAWRADKFIDAKTSTYSGAYHVNERTLEVLENAGVNIKTLGKPGGAAFNRNLSNWFGVMHKLQEEFPDVYMYKMIIRNGYGEQSKEFSEEISQIVNRATRNRSISFDEMFEIARDDLARRREQKQYEMFGGLDGYTNTTERGAGAHTFTGEMLKNEFTIPEEFGGNPITRK